MKVTIRSETSEDRAAIRSINESAFSHPAEADLVDALRRDGACLLSLVAGIQGQAVGHILFTRMWIDTDYGHIQAVALAPMAVMPHAQRLGIGGELIREGLERLRQSGESIVIVLGHPDYYPRFGFSAEKARHLESSFPREAYMALELVPGAIDGIRGKVHYAAAFGIAQSQLHAII